VRDGRPAGVGDYCASCGERRPELSQRALLAPPLQTQMNLPLYVGITWAALSGTSRRIT
jgi:hypothetical protein